jgi:uncharacterized protein (TIGR02453 family)
MIQKTTMQFLIDLKKNNDREWFETNRKRYEAAKENVLELAASLIKIVAAFDKNIAELQPKDCMFRINRDVRFSKNKAPYKNNMSLVISKGGKKSDSAAFYIHIEPGQAFIGCGYWSPETKKLASIRQEIDYNFNDWKKIISTKKFKETFVDGISKEDTLQRPPKGYDVENPAIDFLKLKSFIAVKKISDTTLQDKNFVKEILETYKSVKPMLDFLNKAE